MNWFDRKSLAQALGTLSTQGKLAFALSCAERLLPNYVAFQRESGWGDAGALRAALDVAWACLEGSRPSLSAIALLREQVRAAEPETEDFQGPLVSPALDAAAAAGLLLQFVEEGNLDHIVEMALLCRDTVDMFVRGDEAFDPMNRDAEAKVQGSRRMRDEMQRQSDDVARLRSFAGSPVDVAVLRVEWRERGKSNIPRSDKGSG